MDNVLVVYKKSSFELYSATDSDVRTFMASGGEDVQRLRESHDAQQRTLGAVISALDSLGIRHEDIYRADLSEVEDRDLVVSVGGDGTLLEVSRYVNGTPVLGVNSAPMSSVGFFSCANAENIRDILEKIDSVPRTRLARLQATLDGDRLPEQVLNDIMIVHANPAATSRYHLKVDEEWVRKEDGRKENFRKSGLWVCTAAGSTGGMYGAYGDVMPLDSERMQYKGRDDRGMTHGYADKIKIHSLMREGRIFIDGQHLAYDFTLGRDLLIEMGSPLEIVGDLKKKREAYLD